MSGPAGSGFDRLHPVVQHHVVNTLGWSVLRPLQDAAVAPVLAGADALLLAPTAGGKTEAALFPVLSRMAVEDWRGVSVLYVCPLRALLNNLEPRVQRYAGWLGRAAAVRHGDTGQAVRRRQAVERPDVLLTTRNSEVVDRSGDVEHLQALVCSPLDVGSQAWGAFQVPDPARGFVAEGLNHENILSRFDSVVR